MHRCLWTSQPILKEERVGVDESTTDLVPRGDSLEEGSLVAVPYKPRKLLLEGGVEDLEVETDLLRNAGSAAGKGS